MSRGKSFKCCVEQKILIGTTIIAFNQTKRLEPLDLSLPLRVQLVPTVEKGIKGRISIVKSKSHSNIPLTKKNPNGYHNNNI